MGKGRESAQKENFHPGTERLWEDTDGKLLLRQQHSVQHAERRAAINRLKAKVVHLHTAILERVD